MTLDPAALAQQQQSAASDPTVSAFVSAHAGAGKTKLLIDRLLRLMLAGADPGMILCLTYTKAAAAEMAIRLQRRLAAFVAMPDESLDRALRDLSVEPGTAARARARALFAHVLDLPGGMRISTIHAFCQSLLRRFPLEAAISPHFELVEDDDTRMALDLAREAVLPRADPAAIADVAGLVNMAGFAALTEVLERNRERLRGALMLPPAALRAAFRRAAGAQADTRAALILAAVTWPEEATLRDALRRARLHGSPKVIEKAAAMEGWLNLPVADRAEHWEEWLKHLLTTMGEPRAQGAFVNKNLHLAHPDIADCCASEQARVLGVVEACRALACAEASASLLTLAAPIIADYEAVRVRGGLVNYDDLIRRTVALLRDAGAAWVKFKLDGGIEHILLDEVQDTAAVQWDVTGALTEDFFTGEGAREPARGVPARTVFAVGDIKQSIYSFQGAEPDEFERRRDDYRRRVEASGRDWRETVLDVSFRSGAAVLAAVDAVFAHPDSSCGVCGPGSLSHVPNRVGQASWAVLWPLAPAPVQPAPDAGALPERNQPATSAVVVLARRLAAWIARRIEDGVMLESAGRPIEAGDFLVLVRKRGTVDRALMRELKQLGVKVAGLDRMMLNTQPAVQDLVSLCAALLLPEDDLALAEMLKSPLGGLTDDSLMALAAERRGTLWEALRARQDERPDWTAAAHFFRTLLARVDYASPYALLSEALGQLGGRARLFARLGPEAAEPIDELLASAQDYASRHAASLQGFLQHLERSGAEVKREADGAGGVLRIMTVHGAKGLEAPVVILPDTMGGSPRRDTLQWIRDAQTGAELPLWHPNKDLCCGAVERSKQSRRDSAAEEENRLLYVAMTRARDMLLVCGIEKKQQDPACWYGQVKRGLEHAGAATEVHEWGEALALRCPQTAVPDGVRVRPAAQDAALPAWLGASPGWRPLALPQEPVLPRPLLPSRPEGVALGMVPPSRSPLVRRTVDRPASRGTIVHAMLQHLPDLPPERWEDAARRYAGRAIPGEAEALAAMVLGVLRDPALAALFGPGSRAEQGLSGVVDGQVITGRVDRLAVLPDRVLVADYKTSRVPPASAADVPVLYLRQMKAYRAVLARLYPGREICCVLVWTEGPRAMVLPGAVLDSVRNVSDVLDSA